MLTLKAIAVTVAASLVLGACASGTAADKAGGETRPKTLRIATADGFGRPGAEQIQQFAGQVEKLSHGQLRIEPVWEANGEEHDDWDQVVARKVVEGEMEMGMIPARTWDTEGVSSLRPLHAPFLVTSEQAMEQVATGDLAAEMLAGLEGIGVVGLALVPEGLRHVFMFGEPALSPAAFAGRSVRVPRSTTTYALFEALGAKPDDFAGDDGEFRAGIRSGSVAAAESSFALAGTLPAASAAIGNVTLFPKMNSLVINANAFKSLSDAQQAVLRKSARRTVQWSIDSNRSDAEVAAEYCANGGRIIHASDTEIEQVERAAQVVYDALEQDQDTKKMIARLRVLRQEVSAGQPTVGRCAGEAVAGTKGADASAFPEGVYRMEMTADLLMAAGVDKPTAHEHAEIWTLTLKDGQFLESECPGSYTVDGGRVIITLADFPDRCGDAAGGVLFSATWTLEGDTLRFTDVRSGHGSDLLVPAIFGSKPFTKIG